MEFPRDQFLLALLGFNLGVDFGQLCVIALAFLAVGWFRHKPWFRTRITIPCCALIAATGAAIRIGGHEAYYSPGGDFVALPPQQAFAAGANARPGADSFTVVIPPPNVTGSLHIGHALNNTLQDILVRWHRMRGFDTLWQPGQDHAGIATQMVVERRMAERQEPNRREIGRDAFIEKVWAWKQESGDTIINQLKRLGASCDWSRNAFTMSGAPGAPAGEEGNFHDAVIRVFIDLYDKGIIYRG